MESKHVHITQRIKPHLKMRSMSSLRSEEKGFITYCGLDSAISVSYSLKSYMVPETSSDINKTIEQLGITCPYCIQEFHRIRGGKFFK